MDDNYRSTEQKIWDSDVVRSIRKSTKEIGEYSGKIFYGTVATLFRVPTFIRKVQHGQLAPTIQNKTESESSKLGFLVGLVLGGIADATIVTQIRDETQNGNYIPLAFLIGANVLSLGYEIGRIGRDRSKNLEQSIQTESQQEDVE